MDTSTWERVELLRGWLDKQGTAASADDVRLLRVLKISEEVGEVAEALYGYVGEFQVLAQILGSRHGALPRCSIARRLTRVRRRAPCPGR